MKTLFLLRHAKSGWDQPDTRDLDRRLNTKGKRAAETIGHHLRDEGMEFDHVLASPAVRVRETIAAVEAGYGRPLSPVWEKELYLASVPMLIELAHALPARAERVLFIGHNPGLEELVLQLVPDTDDQPLREEVEVKFPTASLAEMTFAVDTWPALAPGGAALTRFTRPRDLDPALGPDEE